MMKNAYLNKRLRNIFNSHMGNLFRIVLILTLEIVKCCSLYILFCVVKSHPLISVYMYFKHCKFCTVNNGIICIHSYYRVLALF